jgi:NADH-quinone oxidoreductase subunit M
MAIFAASGVVFAAYYMLPMIQSIFFTRTNPENIVNDLSRREILVLFPLIIGIIWLGVYPKPFMDRMAPSLDLVIETVEEAQRIDRSTVDAVGLGHEGLVAWLGPDNMATRSIAACREF